MTETTPSIATRPVVSINPAAELYVHEIGQEKQPVVVVDNALLNPDALIEYACTQAPFVTPPASNYYPGLCGELPAAYIEAFMPALRLPLTQFFGLKLVNRPPNFGFFGLTALNAEQMTLRQAMPHTDSFRTDSFASVHYLSRQAFGGTAFYRHRATGFESVSMTRSGKLEPLRRREIEGRSESAAHLLNELYEEIFSIEPAFNRLVLYRATQLHSAKLENAHALSPDPRTGRLTANMFINL